MKPDWSEAPSWANKVYIGSHGEVVWMGLDGENLQLFNSETSVDASIKICNAGTMANWWSQGQERPKDIDKLNIDKEVSSEDIGKLESTCAKHFSKPSGTPKSALDFLQKSIDIQWERGVEYGKGEKVERSFAAAASMFNAATGGELKGSDVCLILDCLKTVRQYSKPERLHNDSLLDKVSYSSLWAEELTKELSK